MFVSNTSTNQQGLILLQCRSAFYECSKSDNYNNPLLCKKDVATSLTASLIDVPLAFFWATCACKLMLTSVVKSGASGLSAVAIP